MRSDLATCAALAAAALILAPAAAGVHFYRGPAGGCTPANGPTGATPSADGATVLVLHNTFHDARTLLPVTVIAAGQTVTWVWWSSHCHSAAAGLAGTFDPAFSSGFHYPTAPPESPPVLPGLFDHPVPDTTPTLSFTATFDAPGTYTYFCEHHWAIGMQGVVVVT